LNITCTELNKLCKPSSLKITMALDNEQFCSEPLADLIKLQSDTEDILDF